MLAVVTGEDTSKRGLTMSKRKAVRPTDGELEILRVLWETGPATVRQVNEALNKSRPTGYTTTLKLMQIMTEKGFLDRNESERTHVYRAAVTQEATQSRMVGELLDKVFEGSAEALVMKALSAKQVSAGELTRIRELIDKFEGGKSNEH
jgi:predicted transcriptional regulator